MITRKSLLVVVVALLLTLSVSACTVGEAMMPEREVPISRDAAMEGQNLALSGLMSGSVTLTEEQLSSLLTLLLQQNAGEDVPIENVTAMFEPGQMYINVDLAQPIGPVDSLGIAGAVTVDGNTLTVDLTEAHAGPYVVNEQTMAFISDRINDAMDDIAVLPISIETAEGELMIDMAQ